MTALDVVAEGPLVQRVVAYVKEYMAKYDSSHDFNHIRRVVGLAHHIASRGPASPALDLQVVTLSALLHDVGDRKYLKPGEDSSTMISKLLIKFGATDELAGKVQEICLAVSWTKEKSDPVKVREMVKVHPELAVVQDADRIDAIGAIGIGRVFAYGAAKTERPLEGSIEHFDEKLLSIIDHMKTEVGREIARERTDRLLMFKGWFLEESAFTLDDDLPKLRWDLAWDKE